MYYGLRQIAALYRTPTLTNSTLPRLVLYYFIFSGKTIGIKELFAALKAVAIKAKKCFPCLLVG